MSHGPLSPAASRVAGPGTRGRNRSSAPDFPTRLLIDFPNWLGDLAMALPATDRLVSANSGGRNIFHCRPSSARLLQALYPRADIIVSERKEAARISARRIRASSGPIHLGLSFRNACRAKTILRKCCSWSGGTSNQGGWVLLNFSYQPDRQRHQIHDSDTLLEHLGLEAAAPSFRAELPPSLLREGRHILLEAGLDPSRPMIALAPGVAQGGSAKQWPPEKMGLLADSLRKSSFQPFITIGPGEENLARAINRELSHDIPVLGGQLDAAGLASLLDVSKLVIGNDSGPAHLAGVLGVPVISLFGPTDPARTAPIGNDTGVISLGLTCAPCRRRICPLGHKKCMNDLEIDPLLKKIDQVLSAPKLRQRALT